MSVDIEGAAPLPMTRGDDGWFEAEAPCGAGTRYRYSAGRRHRARSRVARAGRRCAWRRASSSIRVLRWRHPDWRGRPWHETVLYELHVGLLGGFAGVARAARLAALGVTAIELMPITEFPGRRNWGYDGVLPYAPDAATARPTN